MALVELIPPEDATHRQIDFPTMYSDAKGMIWENIFQFPGGAPESVVWGKYAPRPEDIHRIGCERETKTRERNPSMRYAGFISSTAGAVRAISTRPGHGFSVKCMRPLRASITRRFPITPVLIDVSTN